ncbi:acyl-CoA N-acyltransferase [Cladochytrium replicatum]|nr:acyl-CoA N-acyltransferase [Cladochytrium replicatum]
MPIILSLNQFPAKTDRCVLRFFDSKTSITSFNPNVFRYLNNLFPRPYTTKDIESWTNLNSFETTRQRIESANDKPVGLSLCIEIDGKLSGSIGYRFGSDLSQRIMTVGYWLSEPVWGKGYATECVRWLLDFSVHEEPTSVGIEAGAFATNHGSRRVLEKSGFVLDGSKVHDRKRKRSGVDCLFVG